MSKYKKRLLKKAQGILNVSFLPTKRVFIKRVSPTKRVFIKRVSPTKRVFIADQTRLY